jgi:hypothetical protein
MSTSRDTSLRERPRVIQSARPSRQELRARAQRRRLYRRRRVGVGLALTFLVAFIWLAFSLGGALLNPALGSSASSRLAEWARTHGGSGIVNWIENEWYSHHPPPVGGSVPKGEIRVPAGGVTINNATVPYLPTPTPIVPFASPAIAGEGQWSPVGRRVNGIPAIFETTLRPDRVHTSYVAGVAWMDTKLLRATLYSGSWIPGGGPYPNTAPVQPSAARTMVAAFNAGFLMNNANGGYYTNGKEQIPLRTGAASFVVYKNGTSNIISWPYGRNVPSDVASVRQNLDLLVQNGHQVSGLHANDTTKWGLTLGNAVYVWRSGLGVTANGALVYVGGPGLNITDLGNLLVRAGAVRAMELDINTDWVNFATYTPATPTGLAAPSNGSLLLPGMTGSTGRYFASWWTRDFITLSASTSSTK